MYSIKDWGNTIWKLFHTIANNIDEHKFLNIKNIVIDLTKLICSNLPCPDCKQHATSLINNINMHKKINTKKDLINFYFEFHNLINKKLNKPLFNYNNLEKTYNKNEYILLSNKIVNILSTSLYIPKLMMNNLNRTQSIPKIKQYLVTIYNNLE